MRRYLITLLTFIYFTASGQSSDVAVSPVFDEPLETGTKVFQCSNGNTLLLRFLEGGIRVNVYSAERKPIAQTMLPPEMWGAKFMKRLRVSGIFNIGGSVTIFICSYSNGGRVSKGDDIYTRLSISADDGHILSYTKIAEGFNGKLMAQKYNKDEGYTIAMLGHSDTGKVIKLQYYDSAHKETGRDSMTTSANDWVDYLGMATKAPGEGVICTYEYAKDRHNKTSKLVLISFRKGIFHQQTIDSAAKRRETDAQLLYNAKADIYELVTATAEGSEKGFFSNDATMFSSLVIGIKADNFQPVFGRSLDEQGLDAIKKERSGSKASYGGLPVYASIGEDGLLNIITQTMSVSITERNTSTTYLGNIGVMQYDPSGKLVSSALIPNNQQIWRCEFAPLYQKGEELSTVWFQYPQTGIYLGGPTVPGYYYSRFISSPAGNFMLVNEEEKDMDREIAKSGTLVIDVSSTHAVGINIAPGKMSKFHLFEAPGKGFEARFALFSSADYNPQTNVLAVMIVEKRSRSDKKARIAWVTCK